MPLAKSRFIYFFHVKKKTHISLPMIPAHFHINIHIRSLYKIAVESFVFATLKNF